VNQFSENFGEAMKFFAEEQMKAIAEERQRTEELREQEYRQMICAFDNIIKICQEIKQEEAIEELEVEQAAANKKDDENLDFFTKIEVTIFQKPTLVFKNPVFFVGHQLLDEITQQSQMEFSSSESIVVKNFQDTENKAWPVSIGQAVKQDTEVPKLHHNSILVIILNKSKKAYPVEPSCWRLENGVCDIFAVLRRNFAVWKLLQQVVFDLWHRWLWKVSCKLDEHISQLLGEGYWILKMDDDTAVIDIRKHENQFAQMGSFFLYTAPCGQGAFEEVSNVTCLCVGSLRGK
jgi:hypothetical protein